MIIARVFGQNDTLMVVATFYRQLSTDIKMKKYKFKTSFVNTEGPKSRANKTGINFIIFILILVAEMF